MASETFQLGLEQAVAYEERFVPALFGQWVDDVLAAAQLRPGERVLDVACGTGVVARAAAAGVGTEGAVTGVDLNPAMLEVAARVAPELEWRQGDMNRLPFGQGTFDVVLCQAAIFFSSDPTGALAEMARVTRHGGRVVVQAFSALPAQPAYGPWVAMVARLVGQDAVSLLGTYWAQGDVQQMKQQCTRAGLRVLSVEEHLRPAYFPDVAAMVHTEVDATPLGDRLDRSTMEQVLAGSQEVLAPFLAEGRLVIPLAGYVLAATPA